MRKNMYKKGELTSTTIIGIIVVLVSFAIILLILFNLKWGESADREICHQSVIFKASSPEAGGFKVVPISLKCKTQKICVTTNTFSKGDCEDDFGKDYTTIRVSKTNTEYELKKVYADYMYDCWSMMGQGKLDVFSRDLSLNEVTNKCVLCSRIALDKELKKQVPEIKGLFYYLISTKVDGSDQTYWQFLTNSYSTPAYTPDYQQKDYFKTDIEKANIFFEVKPSNINEIIHISSGAVAGAILGSAVPVVGTTIGAVAGFIIGGFGGHEWNQFLEDRAEWDDKNLVGNKFIDYSVESLKETNCNFENLV